MTDDAVGAPVASIGTPRELNMMHVVLLMSIPSLSWHLGIAGVGSAWGAAHGAVHGILVTLAGENDTVDDTPVVASCGRVFQSGVAAVLSQYSRWNFLAARSTYSRSRVNSDAARIF